MERSTDELSCSVQDVFTIVEDHECGTGREMLEQAGEALHPLGSRDHGSHRRRNISGAVGTDQSNQPDTTGKIGQQSPSGFDRQSGLSDTGRTGDRHQMVVVQQGTNFRDVLLPPDKARIQGWEVVCDILDGLVHQLGCVEQHLVLKLLQPRTGLDTQLLAERAARFTVCPQRFTLTTRQVVGEDEFLPEQLVERVVDDKLFQDRDRLRYPPLARQGLCESDLGAGQELDQSLTFAPGSIDIEQLGERVAPPQPRRSFGQIPGLPEPTLPEPHGRLFRQAGELTNIEPVALDNSHIPVTDALDQPGNLPSQRRKMNMQCVVSCCGGRLAPHPVGERVRRNRCVVGQQQGRQQSTVRRAELHRTLI